MYDALWTDVHPAAGGHLTIVCNAQSGSTVECLLIIEHTDHQTVGNDDTRRGFVGFEQTEWVTGLDNEGLVVGQNFQIFFNQAVLHPVLANLTGFTIGGQFVWIKRNIKVEVVVDHNLESFTFDAVTFVLVDWLAVQFTLWAETVAVDAAMLIQLFCKFHCHLFMMVRVYITQSVFDCECLIGLGQMRFSSWSATNTLNECWIFGKFIVELDNHSVLWIVVHNKTSCFYEM